MAEETSFDSVLMREKAETIINEGRKIFELYETIANNMAQTAGSMSDEAITTEKNQFDTYRKIFEAFNTDMNAYGNALINAANNMEATENEGIQNAEELSGRF